MNRNLLHFTSDTGWFGDAMPLFVEGVYHIYYTKRLHDDRLCWGHISTRDWSSYEEHPDPLLPGLPGSPDEKGLMTGCVLHVTGTFHLFYAGSDALGKCHMLRATSMDGVQFTKENRPLFEIDTRWYRPDGTWRDPCVFWNEAEARYWMVYCARKPEHLPDPYPSQVGLAVSEDLINWTLCPPLDLSSVGTSPECPDLFRFGSEWALLYYWHDTRIRFADDPHGRWQRRKVQSPNHFDFMAAKRMWDGQRHILIGWIPRRDCDCAERIWGGHMACPRELYLDADGQPACRFIREAEGMFPDRDPRIALEHAVCAYGTDEADTVSRTVQDGLLYWVGVPDAYRLRFRMVLQGDHVVATLLLRCHGLYERRLSADL